MLTPMHSNIQTSKQILLHQLQSEEPALVLPFDPSSQQQANPGPRGLMSPSAISASVRTVEYWAMRPPLLLAGYRNGDARIWDAAAGACIGSFKGQHQAAVTAVVGSPVNNKLLATAGLDRRVLLFDANSRKLLRECRAPAPVHAMAFVPEGDALVVGCGNGELMVYDLRKPNIPCVSIEAHSGGQPVRALAVQATPAAAPSGGGMPTVSSSVASVTTAAPTSATAASQQPEPQQPRAAPASASSSPKTSVGSAGAPQAKPMSPPKAAAAKPLSAPEPLPSVGSGGAARPVVEPLASSNSSPSSALRSTMAATTTIAATSTAATTTGLNLRATTATQTTTGVAAGRDAEPPQPPAPFESGFRWRDDSLLRATSAAGVAGAEAAVAGAGAGGGGFEKLAATKPSLDGPSSSSSSALSQPQPLQQPGVASSAAQPAPAAAGGGGAAVPAAAVIGIGVAASPKEVAVLVEERVRDVVDEMKDELGRGLKGLHLELLRGQEGTQEAVAGLAAVVAALAEENRQLRAELAEMRALGY